MRMRHLVGLIVVYALLSSHSALAQFLQQGPKLVGSGALGAAHQGWSVSISGDGNTAIVGGYTDNNTIGAAWIWTRSSGAWTQQGHKLVGSGGSLQGYSVSLSADGNTAIVGGPEYGAWIWTRIAGVWTQQGPRLNGSGGVGSGQQGFSVALSANGDTAIFGGPADSGGTGAA